MILLLVIAGMVIWFLMQDDDESDSEPTPDVTASMQVGFLDDYELPSLFR